MAIVYDCGDALVRPAALAAAADAVRGGRLVVLPTDTVYGLGADAFDPSAVSALRAARRHPDAVPVPVLVGSWSTIDGLVLTVPRVARDLVEAFWPGGLSLVLPHAPSLNWDLGRTRGTVLLRMPLHPVALDLLTRCGPMAVSSANVAGRPPATTVEQAREQLADDVEVYLDGGVCATGVGSTIVDLTGDEPVVRREGAVALAEVAEVVGAPVPVA